MNSTKTTQIIRSFIIVPLLTTAVSMNTFTASIDTALTTTASTAPQTQEMQITQSPEAIKLQVEREEKAAKIDAFFSKNGMPLAGRGMKMVLEAEKNNIDWRLLAAISVQESTGGKFACKSVAYSAFGYGSCKISFKSYDHAIETVSEALGGNGTGAGKYYKNKTLAGVLKTYNSVRPTYTTEVLSIMKRIETISIS